MAEKHRLDRLVDQLRAEVTRRKGLMREALAGPVPVGMVKLSKEQQLQNYLKMSPTARKMLADQLGADGARGHKSLLAEEMFKRLGPAAAVLTDYTEPYQAEPFAQLEGRGNG